MAKAVAKVIVPTRPMNISSTITICAGILWMAFISVLRASWNADVDYWTLALPHLLQGMGMPFFFVGLTALVLSSVPVKDQTSAAGLMSFLRTLSGAIGTAIVAEDIRFSSNRRR